MAFVTYSNTSEVNATPAILAGASLSRKYLAIQNNGTVTVMLSFGSPANLTGSNCFQLPPNGVIAFENGFAPTNVIFAASAVACQVAMIDGREEN